MSFNAGTHDVNTNDFMNYSYNMNEINLFSINAIAIDIAREYYEQDYPIACTAEFLVLNSGKAINRGDFGNIAVARTAALIPYIVKIYLDYKDSFKDEIRTQIDQHLTASNIKTLQIVALMRASGRWHKPNTNPGSDPDIVYEDQSIIECKKKLEELGVANAADFAALLKHNNTKPNKPDLLYYAILQDAITITGPGNAVADEEQLIGLKYLNGDADTEVKSKFCSIMQGLAIAKIRQHEVIAESEMSFHPITLSFKRMFGALFPDLETTFAELDKKPQIMATESIYTMDIEAEFAQLEENVFAMDVSMESILLKNSDLSAITQAINSFTANDENIQIVLGDSKIEYANNLFKAWAQTWNHTYTKAILEFRGFKEQALSVCKTPEEYLAAINKKLEDVEHVF